MPYMHANTYNQFVVHVLCKLAVASETCSNLAADTAVQLGWSSHEHHAFGSALQPDQHTLTTLLQVCSG